MANEQCSNPHHKKTLEIFSDREKKLITRGQCQGERILENSGRSS